MPESFTRPPALRGTLHALLISSSKACQSKSGPPDERDRVTVGHVIVTLSGAQLPDHCRCAVPTVLSELTPQSIT